MSFTDKHTLAGVALSGGPDSTALAHLLHRHVSYSKYGDFENVLAITVDHGLRPDSGDEALRVKSWANSLGRLSFFFPSFNAINLNQSS